MQPWKIKWNKFHQIVPRVSKNKYYESFFQLLNTLCKLAQSYGTENWQLSKISGDVILAITLWNVPSVLWRCWLGGRKGIRPIKKLEWWGAGVVICLELGVDLRVAQLMPLSITVSCFSKIQIGFTFLVPAHLGSPGQKAVKWVSLCEIWNKFHHVTLLLSKMICAQYFWSIYHHISDVLLSYIIKLVTLGKVT